MGCFTVLINKKKTDEGKSQHDHTLALQYTPSFRARMESLPPIKTKITNTRTRTVSAPSAVDPANQNVIPSTENGEQGNLKRRARSLKEQNSARLHPLPLPVPGRVGRSGSANGIGSGSRRSRLLNNPLYASRSLEHEIQESAKRSMNKRNSSSPQPLPVPCPESVGPRKAGTDVGPIRYYKYEEIVAACNNFCSDRFISTGLSSTMYSASFPDDDFISGMLEATVSYLDPSSMGLREFINEVNTLSSLEHPKICKLLGFHAPDCSGPRMLVYESLPNGSLEQLLFGRPNGPSLDWNMRLRVAICAAQGLTYLHEEGPLMALYTDFSTANIQIDLDCSAKLTGYGCVGNIGQESLSLSSHGLQSLSVETLEKGLLTPKSNVWSYGIVLLELLTGRKNHDSNLPRNERNLVTWAWPYLSDDLSLLSIMDPRLKGQFSLRAAKAVAEIAQSCLQIEPSERPTMRIVVESLMHVYSCWFPMQETTTTTTTAASRMSHSSSVAGYSIVPPNWSLLSSVFQPPVAYTSSFSMGEQNVQENGESVCEIARG